MNLKALPILVATVLGTCGSVYILGEQIYSNVSILYKKEVIQNHEKEIKHQLEYKEELEKRKNDVLYQTTLANKKLELEISELNKKREESNKKMLSTLRNSGLDETNPVTAVNVNKSYDIKAVNNIVPSIDSLDKINNISYSSRDLEMIINKYNLLANGLDPIKHGDVNILSDLRQHNLMINHIKLLIEEKSKILETTVRSIDYRDQNSKILYVSPETGNVGISYNSSGMPYNLVVGTDAGNFVVKSSTCSPLTSIKEGEKIDFIIDNETDTLQVYPNKSMTNNISYINCQALMLAK